MQIGKRAERFTPVGGKLAEENDGWRWCTQQECESLPARKHSVYENFPLLVIARSEATKQSIWNSLWIAALG
jgi:hypothetical protein